MKISLKWINELIEIQDYFKKPEALGDLLTQAGLELETIENKAKDLNNVVVGLILEKEKHPNADKLTLCKVTTGHGVIHQIVCGAKNHNSGDRVVVALPGAILPGNFQIKNSVIRGVESSGMLCSETELGIAEKSEGILILPETAAIGDEFAKFYGLDDIVFEIKVTPNRADVLSHFGLARELSCLLNRPLKNQTIKTDSWISDSTKKKIQLQVEDSELCPRYTGIYIDNIKVSSSPDWLKRKLETLGIKTINNVVDCTNYILQELGQPLHAFDADKIVENQIVVGLSKAGEKFITLDGTELNLVGDELAIKDGRGHAMCLAGLIGGKNSGVSDGTKAIFLESAYFASHIVRKASRALGVETESGYRFSRGVDPQLCDLALKKAAMMIQDIAGGRIFSEPYDIYPKPIQRSKVVISIEVVCQRLGYQVKNEDFSQWMVRLGCHVEKVQSGVFEITPPIFRFDIEHEMDLVEEYARLNGYEHIPESLPALVSKPSQHDGLYGPMLQTSTLLKGLSFNEAFNYSFVSSAKQQKFFGELNKMKAVGIECGESVVTLINPLTEDLNVMRSCLAFGLFENALGNLKYSQDNGRLYELGKTFYKNQSEQYKEKNNLALIEWGQDLSVWGHSKEPIVIRLKGAIESLLEGLGVLRYEWDQDQSTWSSAPDFLHPFQGACLKINNKSVGYVASVNPGLLEDEKIRVPMAIAEIEWDVLLSVIKKTSRVHDISRFPVMERDLALVVPAQQSIGEIVKLIRKEVKDILLDVRPFDIYEGDRLPKGQKSIALRMRYQSKVSALTEDEIGLAQNRIIEKLAKDLSIHLRTS